MIGTDRIKKVQEAEEQLRLLNEAGKIEVPEVALRLLGLQSKLLEDLDSQAWSNIQKTLQGKALMELARILDLHDKKAITSKELYVALNSMFEIVQGLVSDRDCSDVIYETIKEVKSKLEDLKEVDELIQDMDDA